MSILNSSRLALATVCFFLSVCSANAALVVSIEDAGVQHSTISNIAQTETFDAMSPVAFPASYNNNFGTYRKTAGSPSIKKAGKYGGADGIGNYLFIPRSNSSEIELIFNEAVAYFGFWWSAGDSGNRLSITTNHDYKEFVTSEILDANVLTDAHYGSPTSKTGNKNEPYAYVNLFATTPNDKIKSIRFYGKNFETDNHSASTSFVGYSGNFLTPIHEPSTIALFAFSAIFMTSLSRRKYANQVV
ncbi:Npun_F0296 family exosortase-dependent surface protein [Echinimonas agarilytica]|uniref:PEP-CTERM protein-sorting domain-containing protein n=1 Tax=Echinimonas agarilytica TaxID=1215918 RepID=A0AA41W7H3_9GAMM|nr:hypothetical protein [Echinimonas agarilytica]MCM2680652.1 hypothetical protein [Echinimonas agarilytica]